jgi:hypothetical protein
VSANDTAGRAPARGAVAARGRHRSTARPTLASKGIGNLEIKVPATTGDVLLAIEPSRFEQADGTISIDYEAGTTGKISLVQIPKGI